MMASKPESIGSILPLPASGQKINGIRNLNRRIQLHFGREYGIVYDPSKGKGTVVTITLPKKQD
ncbi:sensor histidine kinase [Paenibacillus sp. yr247]|uniref:sensor histidine kinase n=1 Tax=Paenibacillus sp. yr247 TaxID=1761880 RepID=UPI000B88E6C2|nr:hypothetical protein [Paenibacillus sp. yr247]